MTTYCFKCPKCGATAEDTSSDSVMFCGGPLHVNARLVRDYRSEAVGVGAGVRVSRDGTQADQARLILPDNKDFKGPGDPDGTKGMRKWHSQFQPKADNPRPAQTPGRIERTSF